MIWLTGDLHGGETAWHISSSRFTEGDRGDIVICVGDLGGVWYHDYYTNRKHQRREDFFLESQLRQRFLWLSVDGNHENFARLSGEFPLVEIFCIIRSTLDTQSGINWTVRPVLTGH